MARTHLEPCLDCGRPLSPSAHRCPHCGSTLTPTRQITVRFFAVIAAILVAFGLLGWAAVANNW